MDNYKIFTAKRIINWTNPYSLNWHVDIANLGIPNGYSILGTPTITVIEDRQTEIDVLITAILIGK